MEGVTPRDQESVQKAAFLRTCARYKWENERLWYELQKGSRRLCITEGEVADVLYYAHDESGHFAQAITTRKLKEYYWPRMVVDVADYIKGCLSCSKYGTARRSQTLNPVVVNSPIQLFGIDFVGPFPVFPGVTWRYILVIVDYFSRFCWAYLYITDDQEEVINALRDLFEKEGVPVGFYADPGPHFESRT
jgi:hypothetical protein